MNLGFLKPVTDLIGTVIDKAIPDKGEAAKLKADITLAVLDKSNKELEQASSIIVAEAQGHSWLQRNWRPLVMLFFTGLVGAHWFGFTAENLTEQEVMSLLEIVKIGLGGYVVGRSAEKFMKEYKSK